MSSGGVTFTRNRKSFTGSENRGFNETLIESAKKAFTEVDAQIQAKFQAFKETLEGEIDNGAFIGAAQKAAVASYIDNMMDNLSDFLAVLGTFGEKLDDARASYGTQQSTISDSFNNASRDVSGEQGSVGAGSGGFGSVGQGFGGPRIN